MLLIGVAFDRPKAVASGLFFLAISGVLALLSYFGQKRIESRRDN